MATKIKRQELRALIGAQSRAIPGYMKRIKRELLLSTGGPEELVTAIKTGTLKASEEAFAVEPAGKQLTHGFGHAPETLARAEAVLAAAQWDDTVGFANDARSLAGFPYGVRIEDRDMNHQRAHDALPAVFKREAARAWTAALKEAS